MISVLTAVEVALTIPGAGLPPETVVRSSFRPPAPPAWATGSLNTTYTLVVVLLVIPDSCEDAK